MRTCPKGGKRCFKSKRAARKATKRVHNKFRIYRCPACGFLHTTHETKPERSR